MATPTQSKLANALAAARAIQAVKSPAKPQPSNPHQAAPAKPAPSIARPPEAKAPELQTLEFAGGKIFELDVNNVYAFLAVVRGHEGRFIRLIDAQKWILAVNYHQGFDEHGKKLGR